MRQFAFSGFIFMLSWMFLNCAQSKKGIVKKHSIPQTNVLAAYGKQVYLREKCSRCHTQQIDKARFSKVSIDGVGGGLRSSEWLYHLIYNATDVMPGTTMPSFKHLLKSPLNSSVIELVRIDLNLKQKELTQLSDKINSQADSLQASLELGDYFGPAAKRAEVLALIEYLQQIPASPEKVKADSIKNQQIQNQIKKYNRFYIDSDSLWLRLAKDPKNISLGADIFNMNCIPCHGEKGQGLIGPNLTDAYWIYGGSTSSIAKTVMDGTANGMPEHKSKLTPIQVGRLVMYVETLRENPVDGKAPQGEKE